MSSKLGIVSTALQAAPDDPEGALWLAVWATRMKMIADGEIDAPDDERLPARVRQARAAA